MSASEPRSSPPSVRKTTLPAWTYVVLAAAVALVAITVWKERRKPADTGAGLVRWQETSSAPRVARSEKKLVLYDFTAAWCPPCHRLDLEGWGNPQIAQMVNRAYAPVRIVDREREDGRNPPEIAELQRRYRVEAFPTLVVAAADGAEIARAEGWRSAAFLVHFLQENGGKTALR